MNKKEVTFEMVPCPVCGKPMPKKRQELGYPYCVDCSTENKKVCLIEGTIEGDGVQSDVIIVTTEQGRIINKAACESGIVLLADDDLPDMQTFEQQEVAATVNAETRRQAKQVDEETGELTEKVPEESEDIFYVLQEETEEESI